MTWYYHADYLTLHDNRQFIPESGLFKQAESYGTSTLVQSCVEFILMKLIRPADLKIHMFQQATDLQGPTIANFFGDLYTWSYAHWWIYRVIYKLKLHRPTHVRNFENLHFTYSLCIYGFKSPCRSTHVHPTQYFPTCFHLDLLSHGTLQIQTCRLVQIFDNADPGIPAPPELKGRAVVENLFHFMCVGIICCITGQVFAAADVTTILLKSFAPCEDTCHNIELSF